MFFPTVDVDEFLLTKTPARARGPAGPQASSPLASDHVRLFGPGQAGGDTHSCTKTSIDWDTVNMSPRLNYSYTVGPHRDHPGQSKRGKVHATWMRIGSAIESGPAFQDVLILEGKLWNLCSAATMIRLSGLHTQASRQARTQ